MDDAFNAYKDAWIITFTGKAFNPFDPNPDAIDIRDIAHHLALENRFLGATGEPYSVAEHSVRVSWLCPNDAMWGLLHDASEAYLRDVPAPYKKTHVFRDYLTLEAMVMQAVCVAFGLPQQMPATVKDADRVLLATEKRDLMPKHPVREWQVAAEPLLTPIRPMSWQAAEGLFLRRFKELGGVL